MKITCAVYVKNDQIYCCKNDATGELWTFPSTQPYSGRMAKKEREAIEAAGFNDCQSEFTIFGDYFDKDCYGDIRVLGLVCFADEETMTAHGIGGKWVGAEEIPAMQWDPMCVGIVKQIAEMLEKQHYRITEANPDGTEELMWEGYCSGIQKKREFLRVIRAQAVVYRAEYPKIPWRQVRLYDEAGKMIATES